jgi:CubicO group peptidase (beta-lactamase class C family)
VLIPATVLVLSGAIAASRARAAEPAPQEDLAPVLEPIRAKYRLPGLAAAVVRDDRVVAAGAVGLREIGKQAKVELGDRFHIGSCTKTMTAMLIARLVDQGKLTWDRALPQALPDVEMRPEYRAVTIRQLLTFRGGIPPYTLFKPGELPPAIAGLKGNDPADVRLQFARAVLNEPPVAPPGTKPVYSNASFAIAGAIIDRLCGRSWEAEIEQGLFRPLGMTDSVVGPPHFGSNDQPSGHRRAGAMGGLIIRKKDNKDEAAGQPKEKSDQPFVPSAPPREAGPMRHVLAPAGAVSCSILDFARYASARLAGLRGHGPLLSADAYAAMARSDADEQGYTGGTGMVHSLGNTGREYTASGSGGLFLAAFRVLPDQDAALVVAMNGVAPEALEEVIGALKDRYQLPR